MNTKKKILMWVAILLGIAVIGALIYACIVQGSSFLMWITAIVTLIGVGISIYAFYIDRASLGNLVGVISLIVGFISVFVSLNSIKGKPERPEPEFPSTQIEMKESDGNTVIQNNSGKVEINQSKEENNKKNK